MRIAPLALVPSCSRRDGARAGLPQLPARARMDAVPSQFTSTRRQPLRLQGRRGRGLPDLRLRGMKSLKLQVGREHADHRRLGDERRRRGVWPLRTTAIPAAHRQNRMGGQVQPQSASFAKGKYYVEIVVNADDPTSFTLPSCSPGQQDGATHGGPRDTARGAGVVPAREPHLRRSGSRSVLD